MKDLNWPAVNASGVEMFVLDQGQFLSLCPLGEYIPCPPGGFHGAPFTWLKMKVEKNVIALQIVFL